MFKMSKIIKYYRVDNTGWSGDISWFKGDIRFDTFEQAKEYYKSAKWEDSIKWRIVEIIITRDFQDEALRMVVSQETTQERYLYVNQDQA